MSNTAPARIQRVYDFPEDLQETDLLGPVAAELKQGENTFKGTLRVIQQLSPPFAYAEFSTEKPDGVQFDMAALKSGSL